MQRITSAILLLALVNLFAGTRVTETPPQETTSQPAVVQKTPEQKSQDLRADIQALKVELAQAGKYSCCIQEYSRKMQAATEIY